MFGLFPIRSLFRSAGSEILAVGAAMAIGGGLKQVARMNDRRPTNG